MNANDHMDSDCERNASFLTPNGIDMENGYCNSRNYVEKETQCRTDCPNVDVILPNRESKECSGLSRNDSYAYRPRRIPSIQYFDLNSSVTPFFTQGLNSSCNNMQRFSGFHQEDPVMIGSTMMSVNNEKNRRKDVYAKARSKREQRCSCGCIHRTARHSSDFDDNYETATPVIRIKVENPRRLPTIQETHDPGVNSIKESTNHRRPRSPSNIFEPCSKRIKTERSGNCPLWIADECSQVCVNHRARHISYVKLHQEHTLNIQEEVLRHIGNLNQQLEAYDLDVKALYEQD